MPELSAAPLMALDDSKETAILRKKIREVTAPYINAERLAHHDENETFDQDLYQTLATNELLKLDSNVTESGSTQAREIVVLEELGATATSMAVNLVVQFMGIKLLRAYATPEQRETWLRPLLDGQAKVSFALSEPSGGTDVARAMKTTATRNGKDHFALNGSKKWIGGASTADVLIVLARTHKLDEPPISGITMFLVPRSFPGITTQPIDTMGIRALEQADITFENVLLPEESILGTLDNGFRQVLSTLNAERINGAAVALGIARGALQYAADYAKTRHASNRAIGSFQGLQHDLADAAVDVESARALILRAAEAMDANEGHVDAVLASMAKLAASRAATAASDIGMRVMGGWGFLRQLPMQRYFRDARLYTFAPVTDEMSKNMIAEKYLGLPRSY